jgi:hypothetical protein
MHIALRTALGGSSSDGEEAKVSFKNVAQNHFLFRLRGDHNGGIF